MAHLIVRPDTHGGQLTQQTYTSGQQRRLLLRQISTSRFGKTEGQVYHANFPVEKIHIALNQAQIVNLKSYSQVNLQKASSFTLFLGLHSLLLQQLGTKSATLYIKVNCHDMQSRSPQTFRPSIM